METSGQALGETAVESAATNRSRESRAAMAFTALGGAWTIRGAPEHGADPADLRTGLLVAAFIAAYLLPLVVTA